MPPVVRSGPARVGWLAGCLCGLALVAAGCTAPARERPGPARVAPPQLYSSGSHPAPSSIPASTPAPAATPEAPRTMPRVSTPSTDPAVRVPRIRSMRAVPDRVDPLACTPPDPPERPAVVVQVDAAGYRRDSFSVRLMYGIGGAPGYEGEARMAYDANRKAYVYTLPAVTRAGVGEAARGISLHAVIEASWAHPGALEPPTYAFLPFVGYCLNVQTPPR